jgi:hypothetical protein
MCGLLTIYIVIFGELNQTGTPTIVFVRYEQLSVPLLQWALNPKNCTFFMVFSHVICVV